MNDGPWEASFPEEGDKCDESVFICHKNANGWEVIQLTEKSTKGQIRAAKKVCELLNTFGGILT